MIGIMLFVFLIPWQARQLVTKSIEKDYQVSNPQLRRECEQQIVRKLSLFQQWLYGTQNEVSTRVAPSLIVRSEAELFGISSPRFAFRAYLTQESFVNIRRSEVLKGMIKTALASDREVQKRLEASFQVNSHRWIGDSLLAPPDRLSGYKFLMTRLNREFGEAPIGEESNGLVPFVTHINVGGGLCAQAACYMALCLTQNNKVRGIAEITFLASSSQRPVLLHGLTTKLMTKFFVSSEVENSTAQLQWFVRSSDKKPSADHQQLFQQSTLEFIKQAITAYIENDIPLIAIVSLARMHGAEIHGRKPSKPIMHLNGLTYNSDDHSYIPVGIDHPTDDELVSQIRDPEKDNHCVVIVGVSQNKVCINDPASFPFLEATFDQLIDARAYGQVANQVNQDQDDAGSQPPVNEPNPIRDRQPFQFIAVTPKEVVVPLLNFSDEVFKIIPETEAMYASGDFDQQGVLPTAIDYQIASLVQLELLNGHTFMPNFGRFRLRQWDGSRLAGASGDEGMNVDSSLLTGLELGWYWIQALDHPNQEKETVPQLWFWTASRLADRDEPDWVLVQTSSGGWSR